MSVPRRNYRPALRVAAAAWVALPKAIAETALGEIAAARESLSGTMGCAATVLDVAHGLTAAHPTEAAKIRKHVRSLYRKDRALVTVAQMLCDYRSGVDRPGVLACDCRRARHALVFRRKLALGNARRQEARGPPQPPGRGAASTGRP